MLYVAAAIAVATFLAAFQWLKLVPTAVAAADVAKQALASARDPRLSDDEKEALARKSSVRLLGSFVSISARGALAFAASVVPLFAIQALLHVPVGDVVSLLSSWPAIIVAFVLTTAVILLMRKRT